MSTTSGRAALSGASECAERDDRRPNARQLLTMFLTFPGNYMKKLLALLVASMFAAGAAYADEMKKDDTKKTEAKKDEKKAPAKTDEKKGEAKKDEKKAPAKTDEKK